MKLEPLHDWYRPSADFRRRSLSTRLRLGAVAQIWIINDCGNRYLTLPPFRMGVRSNLKLTFNACQQVARSPDSGEAWSATASTGIVLALPTHFRH